MKHLLDRMLGVLLAVILSIATFACVAALVLICIEVGVNGQIGIWVTLLVVSSFVLAVTWYAAKKRARLETDVFLTTNSDFVANSVFRVFQDDLQPKDGLLAAPLEMIRLCRKLTAARDQNNTQEEEVLNDALIQSPDELILLYWKADFLFREKRFDEAEVIFQKMLKRSDIRTASRVVLEAELCKSMLFQRQTEKVRSRVEKLLRSNLNPNEKCYFLDMLACLSFMGGLSSCLSDAERWSAMALDLRPMSLTLKGTRGSILVELDRVDEAEALLNGVYSKSKIKSDRGICALYFSIIAKRRGQNKDALDWSRRAQRMNRQPWLLERISKEFPDYLLGKS